MNERRFNEVILRFAVQTCIIFEQRGLPAAHSICYDRRAAWNTISFFRTGAGFL